MGIVSLPNLGPDPFTVNASVLNGKVDPLATEFNGRIDNDNIKTAAGILASKLNLSSIAQAIAMSSKEFLWAKGADVASATSISLGTDGNVFDITGTTNIQTITAKQAGSVVVLHFDGALTLVDDTGNLELQGSNLTVAAEDEVILKSDGTNWHLVATSQRNAGGVLSTQGDILYRDGSGLQRLAIGTAGQALITNSGATAPEWGSAAVNGNVVQVVNTQTGAYTSGSGTIPADDTIPQNTEGDQYMTLAITPSSSTNKLKITVVWNGVNGASTAGLAVALFQDSTANALAVSYCNPNGTSVGIGSCSFTHYMTAGTTSSTTFKVRAGGPSGTTYFNGSSSARQFGGVIASSITIEEIKAS